MNHADLTASNWRALTRFLHAVSQPGAPIARVQAAFVDELDGNALAYSADQVSRALNPGWEDPVPLIAECVDVLAGAMGVRRKRRKDADRARPAADQPPKRAAAFRAGHPDQNAEEMTASA